MSASMCLAPGVERAVKEECETAGKVFDALVDGMPAKTCGIRKDGYLDFIFIGRTGPDSLGPDAYVQIKQLKELGKATAEAGLGAMKADGLVHLSSILSAPATDENGVPFRAPLFASEGSIRVRGGPRGGAAEEMKEEMKGAGRRASERGSDSEALPGPSDGSSTDRFLTRNMPRLLTGTRGGAKGVSDILDTLMYQVIQDGSSVDVEAGNPTVRDTLPPVITLQALRAAVENSPRAQALLGASIISKLVYSENAQGHFEASIQISEIPLGEDPVPLPDKPADVRCDSPASMHDSVHCMVPPVLGFVKLGDIKFNSEGALGGQAPAASGIVGGSMCSLHNNGAFLPWCASPRRT